MRFEVEDGMASPGKIRRKRRKRKKSSRRIRTFLAVLGYAGLVIGAVLTVSCLFLENRRGLIAGGVYVSLAMVALLAYMYLARRADERRTAGQAVRVPHAGESSGRTRG